jgi:hypothetical protein
VSQKRKKKSTFGHADTLRGSRVPGLNTIFCDLLF